MEPGTGACYINTCICPWFCPAFDKNECIILKGYFRENQEHIHLIKQGEKKAIK